MRQCLLHFTNRSKLKSKKLKKKVFTSLSALLLLHMTDLEKGQMLTEEEYLDRLEEWGDEFTAKMGAEADRKSTRLNSSHAR